MEKYIETYMVTVEDKEKAKEVDKFLELSFFKMSEQGYHLIFPKNESILEKLREDGFKVSESEKISEDSFKILAYCSKISLAIGTPWEIEEVFRVLTNQMGLTYSQSIGVLEHTREVINLVHHQETILPSMAMSMMNGIKAAQNNVQGV